MSECIFFLSFISFHVFRHLFLYSFSHSMLSIIERAGKNVHTFSLKPNDILNEKFIRENSHQIQQYLFFCCLMQPNLVRRGEKNHVYTQKRNVNGSLRKTRSIQSVCYKHDGSSDCWHWSGYMMFNVAKTSSAAHKNQQHLHIFNQSFWSNKYLIAIQWFLTPIDFILFDQTKAL